jgi:hypothetical protein
LIYGPAEGDSIRLPTRQTAWGDPRTSLTSWLTRHHNRPVVYLTFGTVGWGTVDQLRLALAGLSELPLDVLVAIGSHFDPTQLGPLPDSVRVERFVRQDLVLPRVDLAVHHGGSGTLLAAAAQGVPQLAMPMGADQSKKPKPWPSAEQESPCRKVALQQRRSSPACGSSWMTPAIARPQTGYAVRSWSYPPQPIASTIWLR